MTYPASGLHKTYAKIVVNGKMVAEGVADGGHGYWDQTTIRSLVQVTAGQEVCMDIIQIMNK